MPSALKLGIVALFSVFPMLAAYSGEDTWIANQERGICTASQTVDLDRARELRDLIRQQISSSERLLLLRSELDESVSRCSSAINAAHAAFFASSYVDIGAKLSSLQRYEEAIISYEKADSLFVRFPYPNVLWLQALRGEALAELSLGDKTTAEHIASTQVALAREWVRKQNFTAQELRYALLFEVELCDKSGNSTCSQNSRSEAKDLEQSARR
jgi:tetratricopeptide (TPR) repeat protein